MRTGKYLSMFLVVLVPLVFAGTAAAQESPFHLYSVEPPEGRPGEQMNLTLRGEGFLGVKIMGVEMEDIEVQEYRVESNEAMAVRVYIPEFASPGPRGVTVIASMGQNEPVTAFLDGSFFVLERQSEIPPPDDVPPEEPPFIPQHNNPLQDGFPYWVLLLLLGGLGLGGGAVAAVLLALRNAGLKKSWQSQAQQQELPKECHSSTYINRREKIEFKPGRWRVTGMKVTLYDSRKGQCRDSHAVPNDLVSKVDQAARRRLMHGEGDELRAMISDMVGELSALIIAWQDISKQGRDVFVEAGMEGGSAEAKFARYHCVGQPGHWQKVLEWTAKLKAADHLPATFRAPLEGEPQKAYRVFLERGTEDYLADLVKEAARLL